MQYFRKLFGAYQAILHTYPIYTQGVQVGVLMGIGDVISQVAFEDKRIKNIDKVRVIKFAGVGLIFIGPAVHLWYTQLAKLKGKSIYTVTAKKVVADQLFAAPTLLFTVMSAVCLLDGNTVEQTKEKLKRDYWSVLLTNYKVWPLVQFVNFSLVPLHFQVLFAQTVAILWNTYLSFKSHQ